MSKQYILKCSQLYSCCAPQSLNTHHCTLMTKLLKISPTQLKSNLRNEFLSRKHFYSFSSSSSNTTRHQPMPGYLIISKPLFPLHFLPKILLEAVWDILEFREFHIDNSPISLQLIFEIYYRTQSETNLKFFGEIQLEIVLIRHWKPSW